MAFGTLNFNCPAGVLTERSKLLFPSDWLLIFSSEFSAATLFLKILSLFLLLTRTLQFHV